MLVVKRGSDEGLAKSQNQIKDYVCNLDQTTGGNTLMCRIEVLQGVLVDIQHLRGRDQLNLGILDQLLNNSKSFGII